MRTIHIGIGHNDDFVVAQFIGIKVFAADAGAERSDQRRDLIARKHFVKAGALDIEDFAAQRQNRLVLSVAALLSRTTRRVPLDNKKL